MRLAVSGGAKRDKLTFDEIVEMQKILAKGDYYVGPVDGKLGRSTMKGIELYKRVYGISSDAVNRTLLEKMRVQFARNLENGDRDPLVKENLRLEKERQEALKKARQKAKKEKRRQKSAVKRTVEAGVPDKRLKKR